ncbi:MAG TPA: peptide chain release factor-like protein [Verrucomicrobia bacterium]|nr:peptide chain release factor-like protein [Verrucomicrobiota bacterium]
MAEVFVSSEKREQLKVLMASVNVREEDLTERFILGAGSGGQKINKTSSCVYLRHAPSGIEIKCQSSRSRDLNRYYARKLLCERLDEQLRGAQSKRQQEAERIRRQKRRRSRRQQAKVLDDKHKHAECKQRRGAVKQTDHE